MKHLLFVAAALACASAHKTIEDEQEVNADLLSDHNLEVSEESGTIITDQEEGSVGFEF